MIGTAIPDMLSVVDRKVRMRKKLVEPQLQTTSGDRYHLVTGVMQHLEDDHWFHGQPAFLELNRLFALKIRELIGQDDGFRCHFLGHILVELLMDRMLMEEEPEILRRYYEAMQEIDPQLVQSQVNAMARQPTEKLSLMIPRFIEERFLADYVDDERLLFRLNQVMRRVKLNQLTPDLLPFFNWGLEHVRQYRDQLLPPADLNLAFLDTHSEL